MRLCCVGLKATNINIQIYLGRNSTFLAVHNKISFYFLGSEILCGSHLHVDTRQ